MGPRPPRPGAATLAAKGAGAVEVVRSPRRHVAAAPSAPLPATVTAALGSIVRDMRDVPRACLVDRAELLFWLRRMANRVEGVGRMRVVGAVEGKSLATAGNSPVVAGFSLVSPRDLAEAVFGRAAPVGAPGPRTIVSRRGRPVRVEVRRVRAAGQMELGL